MNTTQGKSDAADLEAAKPEVPHTFHLLQTQKMRKTQKMNTNKNTLKGADTVQAKYKVHALVKPFSYYVLSSYFSLLLPILCQIA